MIKQVLRGVFALAVFSAAASADIFNEVGDAGQLVGTAQNVTGVSPLTQISGMIADENDVDVYRILISDYANFSADTIGSQALSGVDTQLYLFDQNVFGIYGNDDLPIDTTLESILPAGHASGPMSNGIYLLAVSSFDNDPFSAAGDIFSDSGHHTILTPTGPGGGSPLIGWNDGADDEYGEYVINLTGATAVPAPGAVVLAMLGMPAIGWIRRRFAA